MSLALSFLGRLSKNRPVMTALILWQEMHGEADLLYEKAIKIIQKALGEHHPQLAVVLDKRALPLLQDEVRENNPLVYL